MNPIRWAISLAGWMLDRHIQAANQATVNTQYPRERHRTPRERRSTRQHPRTHLHH